MTGRHNGDAVGTLYNKVLEKFNKTGNNCDSVFLLAGNRCSLRNEDSKIKESDTSSKT